MGGNHAVMQWEEIMLQCNGRKTCCDGRKSQMGGKHTANILGDYSYIAPLAYFIKQSKIIQDVFSYIKLRL